MSCIAQARPDRLMGIAELEIEPDSLYKNALREEIEASIRIEPGVLTLYAVAVRDQPNQIRRLGIRRHCGVSGTPSICALREVQHADCTHGQVLQVDRNRAVLLDYK